MKQKIIIISISLIFFSCKKDGGEAISNSIFGIYTKYDNSGQWWEDLLSTTFTKVSPGTTNYIQIITNYNSIYPSNTTVFDSVTVFADNSFKVDQMVKYGSGYAKATGTGNFGSKTISLNFSLDPGGNSDILKIILNNVEKTGN